MIASGASSKYGSAVAPHLQSPAAQGVLGAVNQHAEARVFRTSPTDLHHWPIATISAVIVVIESH